MRAIQAAEAEYYSRFGAYGELSELGPYSAKLITGKLATGNVGGYRFEVQRRPDGFIIRAQPVNNTFRAFYSDETLSIHASTGAETANSSSPIFK